MQLPASQMLRVGSKEVEITGPHIANRTGDLLRHCRLQPFRRTRSRAVDTWHRFLLHRDTSHGATVGQMLRCHWWLRGGLVWTMCYPYVLYSSKSEVRLKFSTLECSVCFQARSQNCEKRLLASSCVFVHPFGRMEQPAPNWTDFYWIW